MNTTDILTEIKARLTMCANEVEVENKEQKQIIEDNGLIQIFHQYEEAYREKHIEALKGKGYTENQINEYGYYHADVLCLRHLDKALENNLPASLVNDPQYEGWQVESIVNRYLAINEDRSALTDLKNDTQEKDYLTKSTFKKNTPVR